MEEELENTQTVEEDLVGRFVGIVTWWLESFVFLKSNETILKKEFCVCVRTCCVTYRNIPLNGQITEHPRSMSYVEKTVEGGAPDRKRHMYTKSDSAESHHFFAVTIVIPTLPVNKMFLE